MRLRFIRPCLRLAAVATLSASLAGCGSVSTDYGSLDLAEVSGTITLDGKPLAGASVFFEPSDPLVSRSYATTDSSGHYVLEFDSVKKGVTPGDKTVRIQAQGGYGEGDESVVEPDGEAAAPAAPADAVPACYNADSKLKATVTRSATMNFDLKSDCSVTGPTG
jgi:hypothetical protein